MQRCYVKNAKEQLKLLLFLLPKTDEKTMERKFLRMPRTGIYLHGNEVDECTEVKQEQKRSYEGAVLQMHREINALYNQLEEAERNLDYVQHKKYKKKKKLKKNEKKVKKLEKKLRLQRLKFEYELKLLKQEQEYRTAMLEMEAMYRNQFMALVAVVQDSNARDGMITRCGEAVQQVITGSCKEVTEGAKTAL